MDIKRIQLSRKRDSKLPPNTVNVARPTKWGNPFNWVEYAKSGARDAKEIATKEYEYWLNGNGAYAEMFVEQRQWILDHIHELAGKNLACWCKPDEPFCHREVLIRLANQKRSK